MRARAASDDVLTCKSCEGTGAHLRQSFGESWEETCRECAGSGRRRPFLHEWDALLAERDAMRLRLAELAPEDEWRGLFLRERDKNAALTAERDELLRMVDAEDERHRVNPRP